MCDYHAGQLILTFPETDPYGYRLVDRLASERVPNIRVLDDLHSRMERADMKPEIPLRVHLLGVPEGQELWHVNVLHAEYRRLALMSVHLPVQQAMIVPNSYLTLEGFAPSFDHLATYLGMLGSTHGWKGSGVKVAVVDSGLEASSTIASWRVDLMTNSGSADDQVGHGTAVANVIRDVAPGAMIEVVKIADSAIVSEWDALAGVATASNADVINLSLSFGSATRVCSKCGRQSISSRSIVFESMVNVVLEKTHEPILVAAAGNQSHRELRYPARFGGVIAVGAVDTTTTRSAYSNFGAVDANGKPHANLFFAPGGDRAQPVGTTSAPLPQADHFGTSLATAYATGVVACARERRGAGRARILHDLRKAATPLLSHIPGDHGNGLIQGC